MLYSLKVCSGYTKYMHSLYIAYVWSRIESYLRETHMKWKPLLYTPPTLNLLILLLILLIFNTFSTNYIIFRAIVFVSDIRCDLGYLRILSICVAYGHRY